MNIYDFMERHGIRCKLESTLRKLQTHNWAFDPKGGKWRWRCSACQRSWIELSENNREITEHEIRPPKSCGRYLMEDALS
jgi:hypothetical protein